MIAGRRRLALAGLGVVAAAGAGLRWLADAAQAPAPAQPAGYRTLAWEDLVPADWDPLRRFRERNAGRIDGSVREGDPREAALMREMRELWDNAPTRSELNGAGVRLPGYVVPLERTAGDVREFLLVPYFGACIHSPPPPANRIVHVVLATPRALKTMDTVWARGTLQARRHDSPWGMSGYRLDGVDVEAYAPPR